MKPSQFLSILKARWLSAVLVMLLTVLVTIGVSLMLPKSYTSSATVVLDVRGIDPIVGVPSAAMMSPAYMATQVDILTSDRVATAVVKKLRLAESEQMQAQWIEASEGKGSFETWMADLLQKRLSVKPSRDSNVITISYSSPDPRFSRLIVTTFAEAYIDVNVSLRSKPARQYSEFFEARSKELRESIERAQEKLSSYQKETRLTNYDERFDIETQRLNELNSQLVSMQALLSDSSSRANQARQNQDQLIDILNNGLIASLKTDLNRQEARLSELSARLGSAHPQVMELTANIAELRNRIENETRRVAGSVAINNNINRQREAELRAALEEQRTKVLQMKAKRDEAMVLQREVEAAQRAYDQVTQKFNQTALESQLNQTNVSLLSPASEPIEPSSPKILINTLISLLGGIALGVTFSLIREMMDRRIRSVDDIMEKMDLPVIGSIPRPLLSLSGKDNGTTMSLPANIMGQLPDRKHADHRQVERST